VNNEQVDVGLVHGCVFGLRRKGVYRIAGVEEYQEERIVGGKDYRIVGSDEALLLLSTFNSQLIMEGETQSQ
jgi:hypothetical protein